MVTATHNFSLMLVSVMVSVVAAFTGLALTRKIALLPEGTRKALVAMSSLVIGGGIWTMHFVAMLANGFSVPVGYDVIYTLSSGLISILVVGVALLMLHYAVRSSQLLNMAGLILAVGIVSMHYIGMNAIRGATPHYTTVSIAMALLVAVVSCVCAVRVAYGNRSKEHILLGGLLLGMSVVFVHFTAMLGIRYSAIDNFDGGTMAVANSTLAMILVIVVFIICGAFLLVSATFLTTGEHSTNGDAVALLNRHLPETEQVVAKVPAQHGIAQDLAPAHRLQENSGGEAAFSTEVRSEVSYHQRDAGSTSDPQDHNPGELRIPYERNKKVSFVDCLDVGAIRADGRYTHLYTPYGVFFCPWSITEAEKRLSAGPFYRSHRSYLVNVSKMAAYEKRKDSGICLFEGYEQLTKVPVSRTRVAGLLELLGLA